MGECRAAGTFTPGRCPFGLLACERGRRWQVGYCQGIKTAPGVPTNREIVAMAQHNLTAGGDMVRRSTIEPEAQ